MFKSFSLDSDSAHHRQTHHFVPFHSFLFPSLLFWLFGCLPLFEAQTLLLFLCFGFLFLCRILVLSQSQMRRTPHAAPGVRGLKQRVLFSFSSFSLFRCFLVKAETLRALARSYPLLQTTPKLT